MERACDKSRRYHTNNSSRDYKPQGREPVGRPQKTWAQSWLFLEEDTPWQAKRKTGYYPTIKERDCVRSLNQSNVFMEVCIY